MNKFVPLDFSALNASSTWSAPSWGTTDLFCKCKRQKKIFSLVDVPKNLMGDQEAHSGTCYAGLFVFSHGDYREYLQTPLTERLKRNTTYRFTMYISLADYSRTSVDQLGVCFLVAKVKYDDSDVITDLNPVYISIENEVGRDIEQWHRVTVTYKAHGGESYLLIGSFELNKIRKTKFKVPKEIKSRINQHSERDAYYFIDDVSLVETFTNEKMDTIEDLKQNSPHTFSMDTLLVLKNVLFQSNETTLLPSSYSELDVMTGYLKNNIRFKIEIFGHTDNSGNENENRKLSTGRAKAVATYLQEHGIDKARINYTGLGSSKFIATNNTEEGRQKNRRVEFVILKK